MNGRSLLFESQADRIRTIDRTRNREEKLRKQTPSGECAMNLLDCLDHPSREYTPIPFWFLNGDLTHREIRRQLHDFCDHGVYGAVLHPRMGLSKRIGYLSPLFFSYIRTAVETAKELDMKIVLYDEGMYPSGSAGGQVVQEHPEWASRGIALTAEKRPGDRELCRTAHGWLVERFSRGTIRGVHYGEDDGEAHAPPSADILNPLAVRRFIELTHEAYWREFREYFGSTVIGFFTDEPSILGRNAENLEPWTTGMDGLFRRAGGRLEGLAGLFTNEENEDTALYRRLILKREEEVYYAPLSRWCEQHGIALMGHPHRSDDIETEKYFHIPGQDLVFRWVSPEKGGTAGLDSTMAKCSADMARLTGRKRNSNECFGACNRQNIPWYFTGSDMKWYIDWLAVRGVNLFIPHAFYYSLKGRRSGERPPDVGPGNIWWPHYRKWAAYMARVSCLMAEAEARPAIAVPCRNRDLRPEAVAPLYESQRGFQYLPESMWPECTEKDGRLFCRGLRFDAVLGPEELFPSVSHEPFSVAPDCECAPVQPALRTARLYWQGRDLWFCVNEGAEAIETRLTLPTRSPLGAYDLWAGKARRIESRDCTEGKQITLRLERNESVLLFACKSAEEWAALPGRQPVSIRLKAEDFTAGKDGAGRWQKHYRATMGYCASDILVSVDAPEMVELYANGQFVDAAFWPPQKILIPRELLNRASNTLLLVATGSLANRYGKARIPFEPER